MLRRKYTDLKTQETKYILSAWIAKANSFPQLEFQTEYLKNSWKLQSNKITHLICFAE